MSKVAWKEYFLLIVFWRRQLKWKTVTEDCRIKKKRQRRLVKLDKAWVKNLKLCTERVRDGFMSPAACSALRPRAGKPGHGCSHESEFWLTDLSLYGITHKKLTAGTTSIITWQIMKEKRILKISFTQETSHCGEYRAVCLPHISSPKQKSSH